MSGDVQRLRDILVRFEGEARALPWAEKRRWTVASHIWNEKGVVTVDLHDLNVKLARSIVEEVGDMASGVESGAVCFVTGQGRHSISGSSDLKDAIAGELDRQCRRRGWTYHPARAGRLMLVLDPEKAPAYAKGDLPVPLMVGAALFLAALIYFAPIVGLALTALGIAGFFVVRKHAV